MILFQIIGNAAALYIVCKAFHEMYCLMKEGGIIK